MAKKIKEDRYTKPDNFKDPFAIIREPSKLPNEFEERAVNFWDDIDGMIELLNKTDPKHTQTTIDSPQVNHFLLWRLLTEIKELKTQQKKTIDIINNKEESYLRQPSKLR